MNPTAKYFTLDEANRALPLVSRVVRDIVETHKTISDLYVRWRNSIDRGDGGSADELETEIRSLLDARDEYVGEIDRIGCEIKDLQRGLVDFPARIDGRDVYLCWKLGEPEVLFWHERRAGYLGRQPVDGFFREPREHGLAGAAEGGETPRH